VVGFVYSMRLLILSHSLDVFSLELDEFTRFGRSFEAKHSRERAGGKEPVTPRPSRGSADLTAGLHIWECAYHMATGTWVDSAGSGAPRLGAITPPPRRAGCCWLLLRASCGNVPAPHTNRNGWRIVNAYTESNGTLGLW